MTSLLWAGALALGCGGDGGAGPGGSGGGGSAEGGAGGSGAGGTGRALGTFAYVANIDSETVSQYRVAPNGALMPLDPPTIETGELPVAIATHPTGPFVYVANSGDANVAQYRIEDDGTLSALNPPRAASGVWPYSIAFDPGGSFAYVANDFDGTVSQYRVQADGTLRALSPRTVDAGSSAISVAVRNDGRFVYVADRALDVVHQYRVEPAGTLAPLTPSTVETGRAPVAVAVEPSGRFAYAANGQEDVISQYRVGADGTLSALSPPTVDLDDISPTSLTIDPLGRAVYVGYVGSNAASHYSIQDDGTLQSLSPPVEGAGELSWPAYVAVDPTGTFGYVTNSSLDTISHYVVLPDGALQRALTADVATGVRPDGIAVVDLADRTPGAGGSGGAATTATIGGLVYRDDGFGFAPVPIPGAIVFVEGTSVTATSDRNGHFWVEAPLGSGAVYVTAPGHWGTRATTEVTATGANRYDLELVPDADVQEIVADVGGTLDPGKGLVIVYFGDQRFADGGESADLVAGYGYSVVYDGSDEARLGNELTAGDAPFIVFANVDPSPDVGLGATNALGSPCSEDPEGETHAAHPKVLTEIDVACPDPCPSGTECVPCSKTEIVGVGCENSVVNVLSSLPFRLSVEVDDPIYAGQSFDAELGGAAVFPEAFFDIAQNVIPDGVRQVTLEAAVVTAAVRKGATGPEVPLGFDESAVFPGRTHLCTLLPERGVCNPALDLDPSDPTAGNPACAPMIEGNYCNPESVLVVDIPTSADCCAAGFGCTCDVLGKLDQCQANGFCVTQSLFIPLQPDVATFTADASGEVLFGWWDDPATDPVQPSTLSVCTGEPITDDARCQSNGGELPDGSYALPRALYSNPTEPIGLRNDLGGALFVAFQCAMAEDGGSCSSTTNLGCLVDGDCPPSETCEGIWVDDNVIMPTPDDRMLSCPIY